MTNRPPCSSVRLGRTCLILLFALPAGCHRSASQIELTSYKDPYFPEPFHVSFDDCTYRIDAGGDIDIAAEATTATPDQAGSITQLLHVHVFWQPRPGVTFANKNTSDATIRYIVVTPRGMASYRGTGFVLPKWKRHKLHASIESANLRLEAQRGDVSELFGDARLQGRLNPRQDEHATVERMRALDLHANEQPPPPQ